jgi:3'-phosphoadenosine 5'-phosphosulfate sulfotransferase (PAPS reductase)/FAD synthetase
MRIKQYYEHPDIDGEIYVAYSGGADSEVLLDLTRSIYPNTVGVFVDTGREYSQVRKHVKTKKNIVTIRPTKTFEQVIEQYGYPVVSKQVAMGISRYRNTKSELQKELRLHGGINPTSGKKQQKSIPDKWKYLLDAPFKISEKCCDILKKEPFKRYERKTGKHPLIGTMAEDSKNRKEAYVRNGGCNAFNSKSPKSNPLSFWTRENIWGYLEGNNISYCEIYDPPYNEKHTGCMDCLFGIQFETGKTRFDRMKIHHTKKYNHCMDKLNYKEVLSWVLRGKQEVLF